MNEAVKEYIEKCAHNMNTHMDLTHFNNSGEILMYIINNANERMETALQDTLKYYKYSYSFETKWGRGQG